MLSDITPDDTPFGFTVGRSYGILYQPMTVDEITLNFNAGTLTLLNVVLAFVMFGVALEMRLDDFRRILKAGKPALLGLAAQFFCLPAFTYLLVLLLDPIPSMALGMMLVAACPGGNISNFITHLAHHLGADGGLVLVEASARGGRGGGR